ncbi:helix-turn-helix domain-containing protein [Actinomadura sp. 6N118]|uniref:helix-turn-helix domain-containing protein n=1 Tax=Actinomadura sp. 6N118 TaxID=3375151 RepID=UPI0037991A5A
MEEIRNARGWSQADLGEAVGYTQSWASKVIRGETSLTLDQVRAIARVLDIPTHLLRLGDPDESKEEEDPTNRRQFGTMAMLGLLPLPRTNKVSNTATAETLTTITGQQRRLDATFRSSDLIDGVRAHLDMAIRAHQNAGAHAMPIAAAVSEAAGFAAWLSMDMMDLGSARTYYRRAIAAAQAADNDLLAAYMTGSLATFEIDAASDPLLGLAMLKQARTYLDRTSGGSTPAAWLEALEALAHSSGPRPDEKAATRALLRSEAAIKTADSPPPWPWVFPFDDAKLARTRASVAVRLGQGEQAVRAFAESLPTKQPAPKQAALTTLEVATAQAQRGDVEQAFGLAMGALDIGISYNSERVLQKARQFRYSYSGPSGSAVARFDDRLRSTFV